MNPLPWSITLSRTEWLPAETASALYAPSSARLRERVAATQRVGLFVLGFSLALGLALGLGMLLGLELGTLLALLPH